MNSTYEIEKLLASRELRRGRSENRAIAHESRREDAAERFIGELVRDGQVVYYVHPAGGRYREGSRVSLMSFLKRNHYV